MININSIKYIINNNKQNYYNDIKKLLLLQAPAVGKLKLYLKKVWLKLLNPAWMKFSGW